MRTRICVTRAPEPVITAESGFTLLELLVVLAIAGLIAAVTIPNFTLPGFASAAGQGAREVASRLAMARQQAIFANRPVDVFVDVERGSFRTGDGPDWKIGGIRHLSLVTTDAGTLDAFRGTIRFFPDGSSDGGEIEITGADGQTAKLRINWLTGRIDLDV